MTRGASGFFSPPRVLLGSALLLAACLTQAFWAMAGIGQHYELTLAEASPAVHGARVLTCDFVPPRDTVRRLSLFMVREEGGRQRETRAVLSLLDGSSAAELGRVERMVPAPGHPWRDDLQFETRWDVLAGQTYELRLSLPDASSADGLRLHMSEAAAGVASQFVVGGQEQPGRTLDLIAWATRPSFPTLIVVVGLLLLAVAVRRSATAALLITMALATVTSVFVWESGVWRFYGEYWPDGKVYLAQLLSAAFSGEASWVQIWPLVSGHLHGATPLVPLFLAALHWFGLPMLFAYALLNLGFGAATLVLIGRFLGRHSSLQPRQIAWVVAMTGCHFVVLRGFARPQTDAAGVFFTVCFVSALVDLLATSTSMARRVLAGMAVPLTVVLGLLARIALLPLLLVPMAVAGWRRLGPGEGAARHTVLMSLLVTVASGVLLATAYQFPGLWGSLEQLRDTADREEFKTLTLTTWAAHSAWVLQLALPLALWHWRRVREQLSLQVLLTTTLGFLAMLLVFQVIPWYRYWAPIGPLAMVLTGVLLFDGVRDPGRWRYGLCGLSVVANLAWVALQKSY